MSTLKRQVRKLLRPAMPLAHAMGRTLTRTPQVGGVAMGDLHRLQPISQHYGSDRGLPIDRFYIERFLAQHAADFRGRALEVGDDTYLRRFGGNRITSRDILTVSAGDPKATLVADLADAPQMADASYDVAVVTQTLQYLRDPAAGVRTLHRVLRPGGVLLLTVPGISPIASLAKFPWPWYWSFTPLGTRSLVADVFGEPATVVAGQGNVLAATAFLQGLATEEMTEAELSTLDERYPIVMTVRAVKV